MCFFFFFFFFFFFICFVFCCFFLLFFCILLLLLFCCCFLFVCFLLLFFVHFLFLFFSVFFFFFFFFFFFCFFFCFVFCFQFFTHTYNVYLRNVGFEELKQSLLSRGYPIKLIENGITDAGPIPRNELIPNTKQDNDIITYFSTYNPRNPDMIKKIKLTYLFLLRANANAQT